MSTERNERGEAELTLSLAMIALIVVGVIVYSVALVHSKKDETCTVDSKDRTSNSSGSSDARVYTRDCGVLHVSDSIIALHFNSADTYAQIEPGRRYVFTTQGWRIPVLSSFPNVIAATETH